MKKRTAGIILVVVSIVVILADILAPLLGIAGVYAGFGWKKMSVLVVAIVVLAAGIMLMNRDKQK